MEALTLANDIVMKLQELSGVSAVDYEVASKFCVESLVRGRAGTQQFTPDESNGRYALALSTLFAEAAKLGLDNAAFGAYVEELGLGGSTTTGLLASYTAYRANLVFHMQGTAIGGAQLVGFDWRLDYSIRSKDAGRDNEPVIFVTLTVMDKGQLRDIDMVCSREELKSMVATLRDGCKEVDRLIKAD